MHAEYRSERDEAGVIRQDCCLLTLEFENRCAAQMTYTRGYPGAGLPVESSFVCRDGHVRIEKPGARIITAAGEKVLSFETAEALKAETLDFIEGMRLGRNIDTTAEDAQYALEIAEWAQRLIGRKRT